MAIKRIAIILIVLIGVVTLPIQVSQARRSPSGDRPVVQQGATITVEGVVQSISSDVWTVSNIKIKVTGTTVMTGQPVVGSTVRIVVARGDDDQFTAQSISVLIISGTPAATSTATLAATSSTPVITPTASSAATSVATPGATPTNMPFVAIIIEGPVEAVNVNIIVVYGQRIRLHDDDPIRLKVKVGDWVRVSGNFEHDQDQQVIIVAVVVVITETPVVVVSQPGSGGNSGVRSGNGNGHRHDNRDNGCCDHHDDD